MKQNTTPTIVIKIPLPLDDIERIEFIFKKFVEGYVNSDKYKDLPTLLHKEFSKANIPVDSNDSDSFKVLLSLNTEETMNMPAGQIIMDTLIVMKGGHIPNTKLAIFDMDATLFKEAYDGN